MGQPELIVVGDQAFSPEEWEAEQRRRAANRERQRTPQSRAWRADYIRRSRHPEWRSAGAVVVTGSLHDLGCTGATKRTGCRCDKTLIAEKVK